MKRRLRARIRAASIGLTAAAAATLALAAPASAQPGAAYIKYGSTGTGVKCVQAALNYEDHAGLAVDGIDGTATTRAIRTFQSKLGLSVDGIVGPKTGNDVYYYAYYHYSHNCYYYLPTSY